MNHNCVFYYVIKTTIPTIAFLPNCFFLLDIQQLKICLNYLFNINIHKYIEKKFDNKVIQAEGEIYWEIKLTL